MLLVRYRSSLRSVRGARSNNSSLFASSCRDVRDEKLCTVSGHRLTTHGIAFSNAEMVSVGLPFRGRIRGKLRHGTARQSLRSLSALECRSPRIRKSLPPILGPLQWDEERESPASQRPSDRRGRSFVTDSHRIVRLFKARLTHTQTRSQRIRVSQDRVVHNPG
jgi:hypothetical protein